MTAVFNGLDMLIIAVPVFAWAIWYARRMDKRNNPRNRR